MLVLTRKKGECIRIGDTIELVVVEISRGKVKLGFTSPPDVPIHREEVYRRIEANGERNAALRDSNSTPV